MSDERNYPVEPMAADVLARRRDHAQRNPFGNTAEMVGHIDWQDARIAALTAIIDNLECFNTAEFGRSCETLEKEFGAWTYCEICTAKAQATHGKAKAALGASSGAGSVGNE